MQSNTKLLIPNNSSANGTILIPPPADTSLGERSSIHLKEISPQVRQHVDQQYETNMKEMSVTDDLETYVNNIYKDPLHSNNIDFNDVKVISSKRNSSIQMAEVVPNVVSNAALPAYLNNEGNITHDDIAGITRNISLPATDATKTRAKKSSFLTKTIGKVNVNYSAFPKFYKKEIKRVMYLTVLCAFAFLATLITGIVLSVHAINGDVSVTKVLIPMVSIISLVVTLALLIIYAVRFRLFCQEAKGIDFNASKPVTVNIIKVYKNVKVAHIKANWLCGLVYAISFFGILFSMLISWSTGGWTSQAFTLPLVAGNNGYFVAFLIFVLGFVGALSIHLWVIIGNYMRAATIDTYYGQFIVPAQEIADLKKKANRKYMVIFGVTLGLFFWLSWLVYKKVKKSTGGGSKATIQVK